MFTTFIPHSLRSMLCWLLLTGIYFIMCTIICITISRLKKLKSSFDKVYPHKFVLLTGFRCFVKIFLLHLFALYLWEKETLGHQFNTTMASRLRRMWGNLHFCWRCISHGRIEPNTHFYFRSLYDVKDGHTIIPSTLFS